MRDRCQTVYEFLAFLDQLTSRFENLTARCSNGSRSSIAGENAECHKLGFAVDLCNRDNRGLYLSSQQDSILYLTKLDSKAIELDLVIFPSKTAVSPLVSLCFIQSTCKFCVSKNVLQRSVI